MKYLYSFFILIFILNLACANELSIQSSSEYVPTLSNRLSLLAGVTPNPRQTTSLNSISATYSYKPSVYWYDFIFQSTTGLFQKMAMNNTAATQFLDYQIFDTRSTHTLIGAGLMLDSKYSAVLFESEKWYETTSAYITYNMFKNSSLSNTYSGPGIDTKFTVCRKLSDLFAFGANLNYSLASVKRAATTATETSSQQSLTISYLTVGLEFILTI
jgi:hypothetical protein